MSWRTVVISNRVKLEFRQNYLVCRGEEEKFIHLSEISILIIENTAVALTATLVNELIKNKIKVIFCDEKRNPSCELSPYYDNYIAGNTIKKQIGWNENLKQMVWTSIVHNKIYQQYLHLRSLKLEEYKLLEKYLTELQFNDVTNREGHAAKVYFNALFGMDFARKNSDSINSALNYGYAIIMSAFNREIVSSGYLTQVGIHHINELNQFNLTCDFMEPYRILIDRIVYENLSQPFNGEYKKKLVGVLNQQIKIDGKKQFVSNAIKIYTKSVFAALEQNVVGLIKYYEL